jgi:hypothetical protein
VGLVGGEEQSVEDGAVHHALFQETVAKLNQSINRTILIIASS